MPSGHFLSQPRFVVLDCQQIPLYKGFVGVIQIVYVFKQVIYVQVPLRSEINFIAIIVSTCSKQPSVSQLKYIKLRTSNSGHGGQSIMKRAVNLQKDTPSNDMQSFLMIFTGSAADIISYSLV